MIKKILKKILGPNGISRFRYILFKLKNINIAILNKIFGYSFLNIGAGRDAEMLRWWTGDYQTGFVIDENTHLPFKLNSVKFVYSSMFFEHISDEIAINLLSEINRVLIPGTALRIVVPDFKLYLQKYYEKDVDFFYSEENPNFATWRRLSVPLDLEHFMVGMISSIHNLPHIMVSFPHQEDLGTSPPRVYFGSFQSKLKNYYCGPAPELTTDLIKQKLQLLTPEEFIEWVLKETNKSAYQDKTFNTWHKNYWHLDKIKSFGLQAGFSKVEVSKYGFSPIVLNNKIEKPGHSCLGLYFNLYK